MLYVYTKFVVYRVGRIDYILGAVAEMPWQPSSPRRVVDTCIYIAINAMIALTS
jgi:hypothetical protein